MAIKLGEILINRGYITPQQLEEALRDQCVSGEPLNKSLVKKGLVNEEHILEALSEQLNIPYIKLQDVTIQPSAVERMPAKFSWHYKVMPIKFSGNRLTIATSDPLHSPDDLRLFLKYEIEVVIACEKEIIEAIRKHYGVGAETVEEIIAKAPKETVAVKESEQVEDIGKSAEEATVIKLVNQIILEAHQKRATDIHIEPYRGKMCLRYRIDGILYEMNISPDMKYFFPAIISRVKIMSRLDVVERRLPQDGRAVVKAGEEKFDLRISVLPTRHGEGVVIRILPTTMLFSLKRLGLEQEDLKILEEAVKKPHGIIFVSGPTGSGKSTTLYACLNKIKSSENKIITIEDPVEYEIEGITQIQIMPEIGFGFVQGLRSILRHDPDIMMVGEVRDSETAELAIRIALTGHLVFSTIHTNDAAGGVTRLLNIGIEPFLVASSVEMFIAQRLIRVICPECKEKDGTITKEVRKKIQEEISQFIHTNRKKDELGLKNIEKADIQFYRGKGCKACDFTGFKERTAIYEMLAVNKEIRELILKKASVDKIREKAIAQGMRTLRLTGWEKVIDGVTTVDEVMRVTQMERQV